MEACRGHVLDGCVLVQRHPPSWFEEAAEGERTAAGITFRLRDLRRRPGPGLLAATVESQVGGRVWTQSVTTERLDDQALAAALAGAGLAVDAYLTGDGSWVRAVPASRGSVLGRSPR